MTMPPSKLEYSPLLPVGFHQMTIEALRDLCVKKFPSSKSRPTIMDYLEGIINSLAHLNVVADVWVNGSFLTEKIEPADSDIVVCIQHHVYENGTPAQQNMINWINTNLKAALLCDSYILVEYPQGHPLHTEGEWMRAYWIRQFGFSRGVQFKGMALIKVS
jgi:hypothetical protein